MGDTMADSTLSKLLSVDSDLVAQETELIAQLEAIQAKRASLQTVLEIFDQGQIKSLDIKGANAPTAAIAEEASTPSTAAPTKASPSRKASQDKDKATQPRKAPSSSKMTRRGWREYVLDEYRQRPLPAVVSEILKGQPKKVFSIAEVVDTIFVKAIPKVARTSARERVSNILAEGARKEQWYRGKSAGSYYFSQ